MDAVKAAAADLLQWLDANNEVQVMQQVQASLLPDDGGAPVSVALDVDLMALVCEDAELATLIMQNQSSVTKYAQAMINQQLAIQAAGTSDLEQDPDTPAPSIRLCLKITHAPLPLHSPTEVCQHTLSASNHPTGPSQGLMVSCMGVVAGLTPPTEHTYSTRFMCPACGSAVDVLAGEHCLPCCNIPMTPSIEDLSGRVMISTQQLWLSELSSAAGRFNYSVSRAPLLVHVPEHAVGTCQLGCIVHVIGHSSMHVSPAGAAVAAVPAGQSCSVQVTASSITPLHPHFRWTLKPAVQDRNTQHNHSTSNHTLHKLWDLLSTAIGCHDGIDPYVALGMLLSAAAVGGGQQQQADKSTQVNVLFLHDPFSPCTTRLLQDAADLLSPQSVFMPIQQAEHVTPITKDNGMTADAAVKPVYASILQLANSGVVVADLSSLASKPKQQLLTALQQRATPNKDVPPSILPPMTATCWASASWQELNPSGGADEFVVKSTKAAAKMSYHGFDLSLGDSTPHEEELFCHLDASTSSHQHKMHTEHCIQQAKGHIQLLVGAAALCKPPKLSAAAQTLLGNYFLVLRQSLESSNKMSKPALLASLVRVASAAARLHGRVEVLEQPDATLAVLLMEQTLTNKLGDAYHSLLELPADLHPTNGRSLDDQIALLHGILVRTFRQFCCTDEDIEVDDDDSGFGGVGGDEDDVDDGGYALPDSQVDVGR